MARGKQGSGVKPLVCCILVRFSWNGERHTRTLKLAPTPANIRAAERLSGQVRRAIELGSFDPKDYFPEDEAKAAASEDTFKTVSDGWHKMLTGAASTKKLHLSALRFWNAALGDKPIGSIKHSDIQRALSEAQEREVGGKTLNNYLTPLRAVFALALADRLIPEGTDPSARIKSVSHQPPVPDPLDKDEMEAVLHHLATRYDPQVANYFEFAFCTGLRTSESIALKWSKVDWRKGTILVDTAQVLGQEKDTKTHRARHVDLNDRALAALQRQKVHTFMKGAEAHVFNNPTSGRGWEDERTQWRLYWVPALKALGIRYRTAYQTRHTFATIGLMGGANPAYLAQQLGHANTGMLFKHYAKWLDGADKGRERGLMNGAFGHELGTPKASSL